jgi:hypothetical protein
MPMNAMVVVVVAVVVVDGVAGTVGSYVHLLQQPHGCEPRARVGGPHECGSFLFGGRGSARIRNSSSIITRIMVVVT